MFGEGLRAKNISIKIKNFKRDLKWEIKAEGSGTQD